MNNGRLRIVQISDTHLFNDNSKTLLGVNTNESFLGLIALLKHDDTKPDLLLISGDLSQDGSRESYERFADIISEFQLPVYCIPGNHDDIGMMKQVYPRGEMSMDKHLLFKKWQIILLDSHIHHRVEGKLEKIELSFMEKCLQTYPDHQAIVVFHHHPISVGCAWLDKIGVQNSEEFWEIAKSYSNLTTLLFGHIHQLQEGEKNKIKYYSTPSTCIQFKDKSDKFALEKIGPAYRILDLYDDGRLETSTHRVNHYIGAFDINAQGY